MKQVSRDSAGVVLVTCLKEACSSLVPFGTPTARAVARIMVRSAKAFALALAFMIVSAGANASERAILGSRDAPLSKSTDAGVAASLERVRQKAAARGMTRVIVGVRAAFAAEARLEATAVAGQRDEIAAMQSAVIDRIPTLKARAGDIRRFEFIPFMALNVTAAEVDGLAALAEVTFLAEDRLASPGMAQSAPHIGGATARAKGYSGGGSVIAILDTGVDKTHPVLAGGKVISEACYSDGNIFDSTKSLCPGFWDSSTEPGSAMPYASGECPAGKCDHGTHVAGTAAGQHATFSGVAPDASLIAMQVFVRADDADDCAPNPAPCVTSRFSDLISALERVYAMRDSFAGKSIAAVNMSLGGGSYASEASCDAANVDVRAAIENLRAAGIATVVSSGNKGYVGSMGAPACLSNVVSVGATWDAAGWLNTCDGHALGTSAVDAIACYSNSASFLELLAPGSLITSSVPPLAGTSAPPGGRFDAWQGTSMAAPHVAGAWALLKQKNRSTTVAQGLNALVSTGVPVIDPRNGITKPRIQVDGALDVIVADNFAFTGTVVNRAGSPISGAQVYFVADAQTQMAFTDGNGRFSLGFDPRNVPSTIAFWVIQTGYVPHGGNLTVPGDRAVMDIGTVTLELLNPNTVVLELVPDIHHLGDSNYSGTINSGFQRPAAEGLTFTRNFTLSAAQAGASRAVVSLLAKGLQNDNTLQVNGQIVGYLNTSPEDGSFGLVSFPVPMNILVAGTNALRIDSAWWTDYDDFEFTNVTITLSDVAIAGAPATPAILSVVPGDGRITVAIAPGSPGTGTILDYTAECGGIVGRATGTTIVVPGLANYTPYSCRVKATSTVGDSPWSPLSGMVTPVPPEDGFPGTAGLPAGWSHPPQSHAPWVATSDVTYAGGQSLRSGAIGNYQWSDVSYTAHFTAGTVSFARRVSSESGYDYLEFYVDGNRLARWSGEVPWSVVSFPVTAGPHVLYWRYTKDGSFSSGSDAAWIDRIVLPANVNVADATDVDGDGVPGGVEVREGIDPFVKDNDIFGDARLFAMQMYRDFLGREGDEAGIQGWANAVANGSWARRQVIDSFLSSQEFAGSAAPVVRLYFSTFQRVPDYDGLKGNSALVRSGTVTLQQLADYFASSPEFAATYGSLDNTAFVTLLYNNVLGRAPDAGGLAGWVGALNGGYTRGQVLLGFSDSPEYQAVMANEVFVTMMYAGMLRRTPEASGFSSWVSWLDGGSGSREQVIDAFFQSAEYRARFLP